MLEYSNVKPKSSYHVTSNLDWFRYVSRVKKIVEFDKKNCEIELECIDGGFLYFYVGPFADELPPEYYEYWKKENIIKDYESKILWK